MGVVADSPPLPARVRGQVVSKSDVSPFERRSESARLQRLSPAESLPWRDARTARTPSSQLRCAPSRLRLGAGTPALLLCACRRRRRGALVESGGRVHGPSGHNRPCESAAPPAGLRCLVGLGRLQREQHGSAARPVFQLHPLRTVVVWETWRPQISRTKFRLTTTPVFMAIIHLGIQRPWSETARASMTTIEIAAEPICRSVD